MNPRETKLMNRKVAEKKARMDAAEKERIDAEQEGRMIKARRVIREMHQERDQRRRDNRNKRRREAKAHGVAKRLR